MTFRLDKDALKYNDMKYLVDSGASTFNSKGFSLYTVHGNLRADLAIADHEFCLQIPLTVQKWQDILVTWKKSKGKGYCITLTFGSVEISRPIGAWARKSKTFWRRKPEV